MGFAVHVRSAGQKYGPTCHQRDHADVTEFVTLVRLSSLGQHVGVLALAGYKHRKSALTAGPVVPNPTKMIWVSGRNGSASIFIRCSQHDRHMVVKWFQAPQCFMSLFVKWKEAASEASRDGVWVAQNSYTEKYNACWAAACINWGWLECCHATVLWCTTSTVLTILRSKSLSPSAPMIPMTAVSKMMTPTTRQRMAGLVSTSLMDS